MHPGREKRKITMEPLSRVLFSLYKDEPQYGDWVISCLQKAWPNLVGPGLANSCRPVSLKNQVLTVESTDGAWRTAIRSLEKEILKKLQTETGLEIRKINVLEY
jgi:predicted nucleic acid-binding Zn ribbon protein